VPELMFADSPRAASFSHRVWIICDVLSKNFKKIGFLCRKVEAFYILCLNMTQSVTRSILLFRHAFLFARQEPGSEVEIWWVRNPPYACKRHCKAKLRIMVAVPNTICDGREVLSYRCSLLSEHFQSLYVHY